MVLPLLGKSSFTLIVILDSIFYWLLAICRAHIWWKEWFFAAGYALGASNKSGEGNYKFSFSVTVIFLYVSKKLVYWQMSVLTWLLLAKLGSSIVSLRHVTHLDFSNYLEIKNPVNWHISFSMIMMARA